MLTIDFWIIILNVFALKNYKTFDLAFKLGQIQYNWASQFPNYHLLYTVLAFQVISI